MGYNKKQMQPLIDKYQINPETNKLFASIINMFDGQPNYQLWGVKMIFSQVITFDELKEIKEWIDNNQSSIVKLEKKNIVSYSSKSSIDLLKREMVGVNKLNLIKDVISHFNTEQRKMLTENIIGNIEKPLDAYTNASLNSWHEILSAFNKKPSARKNKFYTTCSAVRNFNQLRQLILDCLAETYEWTKDDLLAFVEHNTKDCEVVFEGENMVILRVPSFESSHKLCGSGRTQWCLARESDYFRRYVTSYDGKRNQYFLFDFSRKETDCFAHIGFTIEDGRGIVEAQTTNNYGMIGDYRQGNEVLNIHKVLNNFGVKMSKFMRLNTDLKWDMLSMVKMAKEQTSSYAIALEKDNRLILNVLNQSSIKKLLKGTFVDGSGYICDKNNKTYVFMDFNLPFNDDRAMIVLQYRKDAYGTLSLVKMQDVFGTNMTKEGYFAKINISSDEYLNREAIDPAILLHKLIDEHDEAGAIRLIQKDGGKMNVNLEFNQRVPIFSAINNKMFDLFGEIVKHPKFDSKTEDGFGETLLESLLYLHGSEDVISTEEDNKIMVKMIEFILESDTFDFNAIDLNNDTAINVACEYPSQAFVVAKLVTNKDININVVNDFNCSALGNCIRNKNIEALKLIGQRPDLIVRDDDRKFADMFKINLDEYIKPNPSIFKEKVAAKSLEEEFSKAMA